MSGRPRGRTLRVPPALSPDLYADEIPIRTRHGERTLDSHRKAAYRPGHFDGVLSRRQTSSCRSSQPSEASTISARRTGSS